MKKILLATTILSAAAGFASADVAVTGSARMGIVSTDGASTFSSNVHATFTGSGATDGGLAFGGSFDAHNATAADGGTSGSAYISGAFGKISMGGVDSGDKKSVGQLSSVGYEGLGSGNSIGYAADGGLLGLGDGADTVVGADGAKVLYTYSSANVSVSASSAQLSNGAGNHTAYGVGVAYTAGAMTMAVGYGSNSITDIEDATISGAITDISASIKYAMGDTSVMAIYQDKSADVTVESVSVNILSDVTMGASVNQKMDAVTLTAYAVTSTIKSELLLNTDVSLNRMGLGVTYDLGGGAKFQAGWANVDLLADDTTVVSQSAVDAGVNFSF